jgi:predicted permease
MNWRAWLPWMRAASERERERDADRELDAHLDLEAEGQRDAGLTDAAARAAAARLFGNRTLVREDIRAVYRLKWLDDLGQDLRYAMRSLLRAPGFAALAAGSTALGIAAASVVAAILNAAVFTLLPVAAPDRLMAISEIDRRSGSAGNELSYFDFLDVKRARAFEDAAALTPFVPASIDAHRDPQRHWGAMVSANYFAVVAPPFAAGRGFDPARDDIRGAPGAVVLGHRLWRARFAADPGVVGRWIAINGRSATIVGVTGEAFRGTEAGVVPEFWIPFSMLDDLEARMGPISGNRGRHWLDVVGRLRPGVSVAAAAAELDVLATALNTTYLKGRQDRGFHVERAGQVPPELRAMAATAFAIAAAVTALVLLTGCANAANLVLGRTAARGREIAARMALGAGRGRLIRQLLAESVLLAVAGGAGGWIAAVYLCALVGFARAPLGWPLEFTVSPDDRVLFFSALTSIAAGLAVGVLPALHATRYERLSVMKSAGRSASDGGRGRLRGALVIGQTAVCALLLVCSGLALRSLAAARSTDIGVHNRNLLLAGFDPGMNRRSDEDARRLLHAVLDRTSAIPGVESATLTTAVPLTFVIDNSRFVADERAKDPSAPRVRADIYMVGPRFFETFGIRVDAGTGREIDGGDTNDLAVVNEAFAREMFPGGPAVGRRFQGDGRALSIAGVVVTVKSRTIGESPRPAIYLPILTAYLSGRSQRGVTLVVRPNAAGLPIDRLREAIRSADPSLAVFDVRTMEAHIGDALLVPRVAWGLSASAAAVGLALALVGVYAVVSFNVVRRRRELGIRLAVGARPGELLTMVLGQGVMLAIAGTLVGVGAALAVTRFAAGILYDVSPTDPVTFAAVALLLVAVTALACIVPARAAASVDPVDVLRSE